MAAALVPAGAGWGVWVAPRWHPRRRDRIWDFPGTCWHHGARCPCKGTSAKWLLLVLCCWAGSGKVLPFLSIWGGGCRLGRGHRAPRSLGGWRGAEGGSLGDVVGTSSLFPKLWGGPAELSSASCSTHTPALAWGQGLSAGRGPARRVGGRLPAAPGFPPLRAAGGGSPSSGTILPGPQPRALTAPCPPRRRRDGLRRRLLERALAAGAAGSSHRAAPAPPCSRCWPGTACCATALLLACPPRFVPQFSKLHRAPSRGEPGSPPGGTRGGRTRGGEGPGSSAAERGWVGEGDPFFFYFIFLFFPPPRSTVSAAAGL